MRTGTRKAFTLVELIIVIVVLGILAAISIAGYNAVVRRSNISSVEQAALSFNRELITIAAQNASLAGDQSGDANDKSTRDGYVILEALQAGDGPRGVTIHSWGGSPLKPVTVWDGSTAKVQLVSAVAAANSIFTGPYYMQFVKNGAGVCLRLSSTGDPAYDITPGGTATGAMVPAANISDAASAGNSLRAGWIILRRVPTGASTTAAGGFLATQPCDGVDDGSGYSSNAW